MTERVGDVIVIVAEPPAVCTFCGKFDELRPYGPNDERICFECAMKDEPTAKRKFRALLGIHQ